jgi:hypothetical protein
VVSAPGTLEHDERLNTVSNEEPVVMPATRGPWPRALAGIGVVAVIGAGLGAYLGIRVVQGAGSSGSAGNPPARAGAAMAFDAANGIVVLFGGNGKSSNMRDTWLWNGSAWTQAHPSTSPPALSGAQMTFDPVSRDVVLVGAEPFLESPLNGHGCVSTGSSGSGSVIGSTGTGGAAGSTGTGSTGWIPPTHAVPADAPASTGNLSSPIIAPGCVVSGGANSATWLWNGSDWSKASGATPSVGFGGWTLATDPVSGKALLLATQPAIEPMMPAQPSIACPAPKVVPSGMIAPPACPFFPIANTTWMWTGHSWRALPASPSTPSNAIFGRPVVTDAVSGRLAAFGSVFYPYPIPYPALPANCPTCSVGVPVPVDQPACCAGTVSYWDGSGWGRTKSYTHGPQLSGGTFVGDPATHSDVFLDSSGQTWVWTGAWTQVHPGSTPTTRDGAAAAFDAQNGQIVRFGGFGGNKTVNGLYDQTWTWDGSSWTLRAGNHNPTVTFPVPSPVGIPPTVPCEILPGASLLVTSPPLRTAPRPQTMCPGAKPGSSAGGVSTGMTVPSSASGVIAP